MRLPQINSNLIPLGIRLILLAIVLHYGSIAAVKQYKITTRQLIRLAIKHDIADTQIAKFDERVAYTTATQLDDCRERLEAVRMSIADLPLGGPQR